MKKTLSVFALAICFLPFLSNGQCCPYIDGVAVSPASPTPSDDITIEFTVTTLNMGAYLGETHFINGDTVVINACYYVGMLTALQTFVESITIPAMPAGNYFIRLHAMESGDMTQCIPTQYNDSVFSFTVASGIPPICDSVFLAADTVYVQQATDSTAAVSITYTGQSDISYSWIEFIFNDSTHIDINDMQATNGVSGPFTYTWEYDLIYNQASIPDNTTVNAEVWIYHPGLGGAPASIDCKLPVTFVINEETAVNDKPFARVSVYPVPMENALVVKGLDASAELSLVDILGRIRLIQKVNEKEVTLNTGQLEPGIYALTARSAHGLWTQLVLKY